MNLRKALIEENDEKAKKLDEDILRVTRPDLENVEKKTDTVKVATICFFVLDLILIIKISMIFCPSMIKKLWTSL